MIVIDGEQFKIDVVSVKRSADFLDKYAERLANGHLRRELIGVYFNYKLQFGPGLDRKEYARLSLTTLMRDLAELERLDLIFRNQDKYKWKAAGCLGTMAGS